MKDIRRTTMREVAAKAGVSPSTVSRALQGHESIPKDTQEKIRLVAQELGYCPDPMLSALVAYRRSKKPTTFGGTLAWVHDRTTRDADLKITTIREYFEGAQSRAAELGYKLEVFWLRDRGISKNNASKVLNTRGIRGILLPPQPRTFAHLHLNWSQFSVVTFGYSLVSPHFHTVFPHYFRSMITVIRRLRALGYRRLGFAIHAPADKRVDQGWSAAFLCEQRLFRPQDRIPPLITKSFSDFSEKTFLNWYKAHKPDAIITFFYSMRIVNWLIEAGIRIPEDVGMAAPTLHPGETYMAGVVGYPRQIGSSAVDLLVDMIHRNERGIPEFPRYTLVEGKWHLGQTLRRVNR
jgi:DNA-binding LacI/PurR family transcriptional regulator